MNEYPGAAVPSEVSDEEEAFWGVDPDSGAWTLRDDSAPKERAYDLEERTSRFGEAVIRFAKKIPHGPVNNRLIDQLVGSATGIGANYCEADDSVSKKDFKNKIGYCRKESRETRFFLRMVAAAEPDLKPEAPQALAGSQRAEPHLQRHLEKAMNPRSPSHRISGFVHSDFFRPLAFTLRHFTT